MSQEALICGEVSYHEYNGILVDQEERDSLQRHLGPNNKVSQERSIHGTNQYLNTAACIILF